MLYYITDRTAFPGDESARCRRLLEKIGEAARAGVDYIQVREKDLSPRELEQLARQAMGAIREAQRDSGGQQLSTALLINSRTDVALAAGADGVHLHSNDLSPSEVRAVWRRGAGKCGAGTRGAGAHFDRLRACPKPAEGAGSARESLPGDPVVAVSCHSPREVAQAATDGSGFAVFAPVFEKKDSSGRRPAGLGVLQEACRAGIPVLALGGINLQNAQSCLDAGAAGIAAIRLFQENDIAQVVENLRGLRRLSLSTSHPSSEPA